jgi:prepilin-type N-terminal cleavage/methylation domain-containing protein
MSLQTNSNKLRAKSGFTIVELLIVIVVIAILAAITIVAYNGITARANSASSLASAQSAAKKLEIWNAEKGSYPTAYSGAGNLTDASQSAESYYLTGVTVATTAITAKPATTNTINIYSCTSGMKVRYWKYDGTPAFAEINVGAGSGTCTLLTT